MPEQSPKRGAIPSPRSALAAAAPYAARRLAPPTFLVRPARISFWGNDVHGDCVTAEEAFAKACNNPEIFIPDDEVISWARAHGVLEGATITGVLRAMQNDGFVEADYIYDDGPFQSVDWTNAAALRAAIADGPVKIGVAADQIEKAWHSTNGGTGWFGTGFGTDLTEDHCVTLCGYGSTAWLAQQLGVAVPPGIDGAAPAYALFTWNSIGIIDVPSMEAVTHEAWLRTPTTITQSTTGRIWHTLRHADGSWQPTFGLVESQEQNDPGAFNAISCAGVGNELQLVGIVAGQLWHTLRHADGSWYPRFGLIQSQERNNPGAFSAISCAGVANELQVVGIVGGQLWHTIRHPNGSWQPTFGLIESQERNNPGAFSAISCAGVGNELHVVGVVGGQLWHTIRHADGSWQPTFGLIEGQERNDPGAFNAVSCAGVGNELQVVGIVGGQLWHTIRHPDGSWQPAFGLIENQELNNPGPFDAISCAGAGDQLQVAGVV